MGEGAMYRIYFDTNEADDHGRYTLTCRGSLDDIAPIADKLHVGLHVIIYMTGELEFEAVLDLDERHNIWVASPIWSTIKYYDDPDA
jgi:hypothetical protein